MLTGWGKVCPAPWAGAERGYDLFVQSQGEENSVGGNVHLEESHPKLRSY